MLQKFKITSYAFIVVFIMVHVFIIPAFGIEEPDGSSPPPKWDGKVPPKPHIDKSTMPKIEGEREKGAEATSGRGSERHMYAVAMQRVIDCNVGLSAYISAMHERLNTLQHHQDRFTREIEECALDRHQPHEAPQNCEQSGMLYWQRNREYATHMVMNIIHQINVFKTRDEWGEGDGSTRGLISSCKYLTPEEHYRSSAAATGFAPDL